MNSVLHNLASHICGQVNLWQLGGHTLPLCQRCTGLYAGAIVAAVLVVCLRPAFSRWMFAAHAVMIVAMIPLGYHAVNQTASVRTVSGFAYGVALVYFIYAGTKDGERGQSWAAAVYLASLAACVVGLMAALRLGGDRTAYAIVALDVAGFAALCVLSVRALMSLVRRSAEVTA